MSFLKELLDKMFNEEKKQVVSLLKVDDHQYARKVADEILKNLEEQKELDFEIKQEIDGAINQILESRREKIESMKEERETILNDLNEWLFREGYVDSKESFENIVLTTDLSEIGLLVKGEDIDTKELVKNSIFTKE
jgi:hypothetical protein